MEYFLDQSMCTIVREDNVFGDPAVKLCDDEGAVRQEFPADWTDDDVWRALRFANHTFSHGVSLGEKRKVREIKKCLDIE